MAGEVIPKLPHLALWDKVDLPLDPALASVVDSEVDSTAAAGVVSGAGGVAEVSRIADQVGEGVLAIKVVDSEVVMVVGATATEDSVLLHQMLQLDQDLVLAPLEAMATAKAHQTVVDLLLELLLPQVGMNHVVAARHTKTEDPVGTEAEIEDMAAREEVIIVVVVEATWSRLDHVRAADIVTEILGATRETVIREIGIHATWPAILGTLHTVGDHARRRCRGNACTMMGTTVTLKIHGN